MFLNVPVKTQFLCYILLLGCLLCHTAQAQDTLQQPVRAEELRVHTESINFSGREALQKSRMEFRVNAAAHAGTTQITSSAPTPNRSPNVNKPGTRKQARTQSTQRAATCKDSSYQKLSWADNHQFSMHGGSTKLRDGSIIATGSVWDKADTWRFFGLIVKYDSLGNVVWAKKLRGTLNFDNPILKVMELSDGSIAIAGYYNSVNQQYDTWIAKLTGTGDLIWAKKFRTGLTNCNTSGFTQIKSMAEGSNGDILVAGTVVYCPTGIAFRLDASGNMVWSTAFKHMSNHSWADGIFFANNEVVVMGRSGTSFEYDLVTNMTFLRLNYQTGALLDERSYKQEGTVSSTNYWTQFSGYDIITERLNNGHYVMAGFVSDRNIVRPAETNYFAVIEFDSDLNYVAGYLISTTVVDNITSYDHISISPNGQINFGIHYQVNSTQKDLFMATIKDGQFRKQRKISYTDVTLVNGSTFLSFGDNSIVHLQNYYSVNESKSYIEFVKMHNSDTSGYATCMGIDTNFARLTPLKYVSHTNGWSGFPTNQFQEIPNDIYVDPLDFYTRDGCVQQSWCDTLKVHGPDTLCTGQQPIVLTAFKNRECGSWVNWQLPDTSALSKVTYLNDTTVSFEIKSTWEGKIYAVIDGRCNAQADSIKIAVLISPDRIDLGKDTSLCPSNTLPLNARKGFLSYRWQDGSTDSVFLVQAPGKYYVTAKNACGIEYTDTVVVSAAPPIPFDLGAAVSKCNKDSVTITAPAGFLNYSWSPAYNVTNTTEQKLTAFPAVDTMYYVAAEKSPGCFAYDSIRIAVHHSPVISLGRDTSFCRGDSIVLNAGTGFQSYTWNTGASSSFITARSAGSYIIRAVDYNNCPAADTLRVLNVYALPVSQLNKDPFLCTASSRQLTPGTGFSSYQWQDGSTQPQQTVSATGTYWVKITDANQCSSSDTTIINTILPLPKGFLPIDTVLCAYSSMNLKPSESFSRYAWSTGATSSSITITQSGVYGLTVTDRFGCQGMDTITILPKECLKGLFFPNAFSPNGDRKNDVFKPVAHGLVVKYELTIYNRWGQRIFSTGDVHKGWDGTVGGLPQDTGGYTWTCTWQLANEPVQNNRGMLMLVR